MTFYSWSADLSVGNAAIDEDHRELIGLINRLHAAMERGRGGLIMNEVLAELIDYIDGHFKREEDYMHKLLYVGFTEHKKEHQVFMRQVQSLQSAAAEGILSMAVPTLLVMRDWLTRHILQSDRALADTIRNAPA